MIRGAVLSVFLGLMFLGANAGKVQRECTPLTEAAQDAGLTTLLAALEAASLVETVTAPDASLTVFAPSNDAFDAALDALGLTLEDLVANTELLTEILLYHVLPESFSAGDFGEGGTFTTALGDASSCGVGDVDVVVGDVVTIAGGETSANVTVADVETCTAIVHVIDFVLLPCPLSEPEATDVVTVATDAGLTTLVDLVSAAGLVEAVSAGNLTIFAPTNDAFDAALSSLGVSVEDLTLNEGLLTEILTYHVLPQPLSAADFGEGGTFDTLLGDASSCGVGTVDVVVDDGVTIEGGFTSATVVIADVAAGTTIVHVIDNVLLPCEL